MKARRDDAGRTPSEGPGPHHGASITAPISLREGHASIHAHLAQIERVLKALPIVAPAELFDLVVQLRGRVNQTLSVGDAADAQQGERSGQ